MGVVRSVVGADRKPVPRLFRLAGKRGGTGLGAGYVVAPARGAGYSVAMAWMSGSVTQPARTRRG